MRWRTDEAVDFAEDAEATGIPGSVLAREWNERTLGAGEWSSVIVAARW